MKTALALTMVVVGLTACQSTKETRAYGTEIRIRYAEVIGVERVPAPSAAPAGAIIGGFTGLALARRQSSGEKLAAGIGGAALGGLATRALEGDRRVYRYALQFNDGSESKFITEKGYLIRSDCVAVETAAHANVRRVDSSYCGGRRIKTQPVTHLLEAEQCHEAKKLLLTAQGQDEVDAAVKKVEVLCRFEQ